VIPLNIDKKLFISIGVILLFAVNTQKTTISLSTDGERFTDNPIGNDVEVRAGNLIYVKLTPQNNNKRVFLYDPRHSSKAGTFETKCFEMINNKCVSSLAVYKTPTDTWMNGVYTVKAAGVSGKAEFTLQDSKYGG